MSCSVSLHHNLNQPWRMKMHRRKKKNLTNSNPPQKTEGMCSNKLPYELHLGLVLTKQGDWKERGGSAANSVQSVCRTRERERVALSSTRRCLCFYSFPYASASLSSSCDPNNSLVLTSNWKQVQGEQASSLQFGTWSVLIGIQLKAVTAD